MKKFAYIVTVVIAMFICGSMTAHAYDDTLTVELAYELLDAGTVTVQTGAADMADINKLTNEIQAYIDAISTQSTTPSITGACHNLSREDGYVVYTIQCVETYADDATWAEITANAGTSVHTINSYLKSVLEYDYDALKRNTLSQNDDCAMAVTALQTGKAICQGYANAFTMLAEQIGVKNIKLRGHVGTEYHVCNVISTDTGYRVIDVTWNDSNDDCAMMIPLEQYIAENGFVPTINVETAFAAKYAA